MAFGDYWKAVSGEDFDKIQEHMGNYWNENDDVDLEAIDWAYVLFGDKYGKEIRLVEKFEYKISTETETGEQFYIDDSGKKVYGEWTSSHYSGYRYVDSENKNFTIEYVEADNNQIWKKANELAQNHWKYAPKLKPAYPWISFDEYQQQLDQAGF